MKLTKNQVWFEALRQFGAALTLTAVFVVPLATSAQQKTIKNVAQVNQTTETVKAKSLTEEEKILHVLNRLAFGARPNDLEKVRRIGVKRYIEQQLEPASLNDDVAESKVQNLNVLKLSNAELFARYPNQAGILQIVAQRNGLSRKQLRGELKEQKKIDGAMRDGGGGEAMAMEKSAPEAGAEMKKDAGNTLMQNPAALTESERREYQRQVVELYREYGFGRPAEITQQLIASRILRAVYSERQLQEQMVDFWSNHFNVYAGKASTRWFLPEYDRDVIRPNALGNFRDLLIATAKSPAMLFYLDNFQSVAPNAGQNLRRTERLQRMIQNGQVPARAKERLRERFPDLSDAEIEQRLKNQMQNQMRNRRGINENYARELMELHTLGVNGGYTQKDVQEIARCFTGWTIVDARGYKDLAAKLLGEEENKALKGLQILLNVPADAQSGTFYFNERAHDKGEKIVLGQKIASGGGIEDGLKVIDILVKHPATAKFIARKLAVKFVNDNPSEGLVNRVADAFQKSNGDIKTTLRALFESPEFFAPENYRAKIKTPFEVLASSIRTLGAETNASPALQGMLTKMGEPLYGYIAPTGYPDTAQDWVNTGGLLGRLNFGLALAANRIPGTRVDLNRFVERGSDDKEKVLETFSSVILHGAVSPATKATLLKQINQPSPEPNINSENASEGIATKNVAMEFPDEQKGGRKRGAQMAANRLLPPSGNAETIKIVGLILGSPEFQRQ